MFTHYFIIQVSLSLGLSLVFIAPARSQVTPNGLNTRATPQGNQINITGGTQAGANLFHSFRDFNVNSAQIANFLSNPQIQNILARINGGNPSFINGLLQVTGGNSNLFLMNPAGIVFGQGASLNVPASFTATTANQIGFGNNVFNALGNNNFSALIGNPDSFIFTTTQAGSIVNGGNLAVGNGQNLSLIGGNTINTGRLTAPGGEIQVLAVPGTNRVRLSQPGQVLSLEIVPPDNNQLRAVDLPALLTGQNLPGIVTNGETIQVATLNVSQSQDNLNQIIAATGVKPALIYVFFSPENDTNFSTRTANSVRGQITRIPNDTDILEIVLVPPNGDLVRVRYPNLRRPEVLRAARQFQSEVTNFRSPRGYLAPAQKFYKWLIAPLEDELKKQGINNLVFLTDVGLQSIPLSAMHTGNGFIIENYSLALMPSLSLTDTTYKSLKGSQVLAMGADSFTNNSALPGVSLELNIINQIWGGNTFLNENFTLNNLRQARRPEQRIVHLATQSSFVAGSIPNSFIQLWGDERLALDEIRRFGWDNPPVDLLVLSACQTALGDREAELGFAGLAVQSGVRSALASLWVVSDAGTLGLMTEFYQQLQITTTKSEALRQAQLAMLRGEVRLEGGELVTPKGKFALNDELKRLGDRRLTHPYFWSAFTLVGNPW